jgi:hypothetical protein
VPAKIPRGADEGMVTLAARVCPFAPTVAGTVGLRIGRAAGAGVGTGASASAFLLSAAERTVPAAVVERVARLVVAGGGAGVGSLDTIRWRLFGTVLGGRAEADARAPGPAAGCAEGVVPRVPRGCVVGCSEGEALRFVPRAAVATFSLAESAAAAVLRRLSKMRSP